MDLGGTWHLLVDDAFLAEYDAYLRRLGQPALVRAVARTVIGSTREVATQAEGGRVLALRGTNVRGAWERVLEASTRDEAVAAGEKEEDGAVSAAGARAAAGHARTPLTTADGERVSTAAWWEDAGRVHVSWVLGGARYGGGDFESRRSLTDGGNLLACESAFHPRTRNRPGREEGPRGPGPGPARVTWRFLREGAIYGDAAPPPARALPQVPALFDVRGRKKEGGAAAAPGEDRQGDALPRPGLIVGDIMDQATVTTDDDDEGGGTAAAAAAAGDRRRDVVRAALDWVPPRGDRWAIAAPGVDLSGRWKLLVGARFREDYERFLEALGERGRRGTSVATRARPRPASVGPLL